MSVEWTSLFNLFSKTPVASELVLKAKKEEQKVANLEGVLRAKVRLLAAKERAAELKKAISRITKSTDSVALKLLASAPELESELEPAPELAPDESEPEVTESEPEPEPVRPPLIARRPVPIVRDSAPATRPSMPVTRATTPVAQGLVPRSVPRSSPLLSRLTAASRKKHG